MTIGIYPVDVGKTSTNAAMVHGVMDTLPVEVQGWLLMRGKVSMNKRRTSGH